MTSGPVHLTMDQLRGVEPKKPRGPLGPVIGAASLVLLLEASYFKTSRLLSWLQWDLTALAAGLVALAVAVAWVRHNLTLPRGSGEIAALFLTFLPAAFMVDVTRYGDRKVLHLFTLTLLCAVAPLFLLRSDRTRHAFAVAIAVGGLAYGVLARFIDPNLGREMLGRVTVEGGNTIQASRAAGAALIVLAVYLGRRRLPWWLGLIGIGFLGTVMFQAGSRGPLLAAVVALVLCVLLAPGARGRRSLRITGLVVALGGFGWLGLQAAPDVSADRLVAVAQLADNSSQARVDLIGQTVPLILTHPGGIGWGDLYLHLPVHSVLDSGYAQYPHNIVLEVFSEGGWLPGVALLAVMVAAFRRGRTAMGTPAGMAVFALLTFTTLNAMVSGDVNDNRFFFALLGAALALPNRSGDVDVHVGPLDLTGADGGATADAEGRGAAWSRLVSRRA